MSGKAVHGTAPVDGVTSIRRAMRGLGAAPLSVLTVCALIGGVALGSLDLGDSFTASWPAWLIAIPIVAALGVGLVAVLRRIDRHRSADGPSLVLAAALGAVVAVPLSGAANEATGEALAHVLSPTGVGTWKPPVAGALNEEWVKGVCIALVLLSRPAVLTRPMHGLLVGAAVGIGFQVAEDLLYAAQGATAHPVSDVRGALDQARGRLAGAVLSHWSMSALVGTGLVVALGRGRPFRSPWAGIAVAAACAAFAIALHFARNAGTGLPDATTSVMTLASTAVVIGLLVLAAGWARRCDRRALLPLATARPSAVDDVALGTRRARREAIRAARRAGGRAAVRDLRRDTRARLDELQRAARLDEDAQRFAPVTIQAVPR